jgi:hypothetical protein
LPASHFVVAGSNVSPVFQTAERALGEIALLIGCCIVLPADKLVRIVWAVLRHGGTFDAAALKAA